MESITVRFDFSHREKKELSHENWLLAYIYEGRGALLYDGMQTAVKEGEFVIVKPHTAYAFVSPPEKEGALVRMCCCYFTQEYFERMLQSCKAVLEGNAFAMQERLLGKNALCIQMSDVNAHNVKHLLWLVAHEYNHFTVGSDMIMQCAMNALCVTIFRLYEYQRQERTSVVTKNDEIDELMKYMRSNFGHPLSLEQLADHVHLSREYLSRYFKQYTGKNISAYLLEIRMERAMEMLRSGSHTVTDIGAYCGYPTVGNFQKAFRKYTGMSPGEYRKVRK